MRINNSELLICLGVLDKNQLFHGNVKIALYSTVSFLFILLHFEQSVLIFVENCDCSMKPSFIKPQHLVRLKGTHQLNVCK